MRMLTRFHGTRKPPRGHAVTDEYGAIVAIGIDFIITRYRHDTRAAEALLGSHALRISSPLPLGALFTISRR